MKFAAIAFVALLAGGTAQQSEAVHQTDDEFVRFAVAGSIAEVELGQVAADHGFTAQVKQFGRKMVEDHDKAGKDAKALATKMNVPVPTALDGEHAALKSKLLGLKGPEFDRVYMDAMVDDHRKTADAFRAEAQNGTDPAVKALASKTLPTIEAHQKMAEQIDSTLGTR